MAVIPLTVQLLTPSERERGALTWLPTTRYKLRLCDRAPIIHPIGGAGSAIAIGRAFRRIEAEPCNIYFSAGDSDAPRKGVIANGVVADNMGGTILPWDSGMIPGSGLPIPYHIDIVIPKYE